MKITVMKRRKQVTESEPKSEPEPVRTKPQMEFGKRKKSPVKAVKPKKPIVK
jgi:hypothetical protein